MADEVGEAIGQGAAPKARDAEGGEGGEVQGEREEQRLLDVAGVAAGGAKMDDAGHEGVYEGEERGGRVG
ncbi:hypothetical protein LBMAG48_03180 [Phycisphaerae bacterium]|nr:hypothetical protein LBMAG48_03180 [Phycisphaerae bacterium]